MRLLWLPLTCASGCKATVPFPFLPLAQAELLPCARATVTTLSVHLSLLSSPSCHQPPHSTEAHLPSWSGKQHLSKTLCIPLHDFLVEWEHDLGLADSIYPCVCLYFFGIFSYQLLQTPNSILPCRDCTCMWFQVLLPMRELHGSRKNSINCS